MARDETLVKGRFHLQDGETEFDFITVDGIGLPPFPAASAPGGFPQRIRDIKDLECRPDDVLLVTYPKCGTNWTGEIIYMLQGEKKYHLEKKLQGGLEAVPDLRMLDHVPSPRLLGTHLPYRWLPRKHIEKGGKIVHVTRNPKDAYVSYFYMAKSTLLMGAKTKNMTWNQFFDTCVMTKNSVFGSWFDHEREMSAAKKTNKNILTVCFEKMKENQEREIKRIADFLGVSYTESDVKKIADMCRFDNLKKADDLSREAQMKTEIFKNMKKNMSEGAEIPKIYRKGIVGDWKNHFTVAQNEIFEKMFNEEMKDIDTEVLYSI